MLKFCLMILWQYLKATDPSKIGKVMFKLKKKYGPLKDLDNEKFRTIVEKISAELANNFTNEEIVDEFYGGDDDTEITRIGKLLVPAHKLYDHEHGYYQDSSDSEPG